MRVRVEGEPVSKNDSVRGVSERIESMDRWGERAGKDFLAKSILNKRIKRSDLFPNTRKR